MTYTETPPPLQERPLEERILEVRAALARLQAKVRDQCPGEHRYVARSGGLPCCPECGFRESVCTEAKWVWGTGKAKPTTTTARRTTVDETSTRAWEQLTEFRVLLDLTSERLFDLQRDFLALQQEMVKCYAMLATLPVPVESQPAGDDIWGPGWSSLEAL